MTEIRAELIDRLGSDLTVANAARVSFAKSHKTLMAGDRKLIKFLAREGHWSPFGTLPATISAAKLLYSSLDSL